jgi:hypothetical protein
MTSAQILAVILTSALVAGAIYRYCQVRHYPIGIGWSTLSPDGRYCVHATTFYDRSFFGRRTEFYEFEVEDRVEKRAVIKERTKPMPEDEAEDLASEECIRWSADSKSVAVVVGWRTLWEYHIGAEPRSPPDPGHNRFDPQ